MEKERRYRHEYKFIIDARQQADLFYRLKSLIPVDSHVAETGSYWIRSAYFDDYQNSCFYENESGINERAKYRIRIYNASDERITLERKSKKNGMTCKESARLTRQQCDELLAGRALKMDESYESWPQVLKEFNVLVMSKGYRAKTIVEYERVPLVYTSGNVRITFDRNISSNLDIGTFFKKEGPRYPILRSGQLILEVKFDEFLPDFIRRRLEIGKLSQTSFSKYYLCRKYTIPAKGGRLS